jgi:hypothetical protein
MQQAFARWIPDIVLTSVSASKEPDSETLTLNLVWGIPNATQGASASQQTPFAFGPIAQTITA